MEDGHMIHEILASFSAHPLCVHAESFGAWARGTAALSMDVLAINSQDAKGRPGFLSMVGDVAVMDVSGVINQRGDIQSRVTNSRILFPAETAAQQVRSLAADSSVKAIVLDVNSGGGTVAGTSALSDAINQAKAIKPVTAVVNEYAYSAAYWIASAADRVVISPEGGAGSIGVYTQHIDWSQFYESLGIKVTTIHAGELKAAHARPLNDKTHAAIQAEIDSIEKQFVAAVARNRNTTVSDVRERMADGRTFVGREAVKAGLADSVGRLSDVLSTLQSQGASYGRKQRQSGRAAGGFGSSRACASYAAGFIR
jgi:signal peptide peptidase SppA